MFIYVCLFPPSEHAQFVCEVKEDLLQRLTRAEAVAHRLLGEGLLSEDAYFSVSDAVGGERRAQELWAGLETGGIAAKDGFYRALFHCQPLLYRELGESFVVVVAVISLVFLSTPLFS